MASTLIAHSPKFNSQLVTLDALRNLPTPVSQGVHHRPQPHAFLTETIEAEVISRGYAIERRQLALAKNGAAMFGVLDIVPTVPVIDVNVNDAIARQRGISFGFRNSTDRTMAIKAVAGTRVFVCDNLSMSGEMFAMTRKNTVGLDLAEAVSRGFDTFLVQVGNLNFAIAKQESKYIGDGDTAKGILYGVFAQEIVPLKLFKKVEEFYFRPDESMTDCTPRTLWGAHNAVTRALQFVKPTRRFAATVAVGKYFDALVK